MKKRNLSKRTHNDIFASQHAKLAKVSTSSKPLAKTSRQQRLVKKNSTLTNSSISFVNDPLAMI